MPPSSQSAFSGVLFDLDDTLNDRNATWRAFVGVLLREYKDCLPEADPEEVYRQIVESDRGGYRPKDELFGELRQRIRWTSAPSAQNLEAFWRAHFPGCMVERAGANALLQEMRVAGLRLGIVTNGRVAMQSAKLASLGLERLVDAVVISEAVGVKKPHPGIFSEALRQIDCTRETVLFVGDNPEVDIIGAGDFGMRTAWIRLDRTWPPELVPSDYVISSLDELRPILRLAK